MNKIIWKVKKFQNLDVQELYQIFKSRIEVFALEQNILYQDADDLDQNALHLWAEIEGKIVAYCRAFPPGIKYTEASIGRVLTTQRRLGLGKMLVSYAIEIIENRFRTSSIRISAQDYLLKFYKDFGFMDTGKKYLEERIPHTEMVKEG